MGAIGPIHGTGRRGTGRMPVEVAAVRGTRLPIDDDDEAETYCEAALPGNPSARVPRMLDSLNG